MHTLMKMPKYSYTKNCNTLVLCSQQLSTMVEWQCDRSLAWWPVLARQTQNLSSINPGTWFSSKSEQLLAKSQTKQIYQGVSFLENSKAYMLIFIQQGWVLGWDRCKWAFHLNGVLWNLPGWQAALIFLQLCPMGSCLASQAHSTQFIRIPVVLTPQTSYF